jgi:DNA (cytosine-5)-methyltransferase 1
MDARVLGTGVPPRPTFIDLFAGCGGLSLGLCDAGWKGRLAIERAEDAFKTFSANFLSEHGLGPHRFDWPKELEKRAFPIEVVLSEHRDVIAGLRGKIDLIAGGPPCQGFSFAGRRKGSDPRNNMFLKYVEFVDLVRPRFLLLENVPGMGVAHKSGRGKSKKTFVEKLVDELRNNDYFALGTVLDSADFGVPQKRTRLVVLGIDMRCPEDVGLGTSDEEFRGFLTKLFVDIKGEGRRMVEELGGQKVSSRDAISDLEGAWGPSEDKIPYTLEDSRRGFCMVRYKGTKTKYQAMMNAGVPHELMDSMRLANHRGDIEEKFLDILSLSEGCGRRGINITADIRERWGMLKHRTVPMDASKPAPTLTTLPDDILHYIEPRILTVREYARLQSFPDWFVFKGKYTTGGARRREECPRYTQVGNAVPPLLSRAIGASISKFLARTTKERHAVFSERAHVAKQHAQKHELARSS